MIPKQIKMSCFVALLLVLLNLAHADVLGKWSDITAEHNGMIEMKTVVGVDSEAGALASEPVGGNLRKLQGKVTYDFRMDGVYTFPTGTKLSASAAEIDDLVRLTQVFYRRVFSSAYASSYSDVTSKLIASAGDQTQNPPLVAVSFSTRVTFQLTGNVPTADAALATARNINNGVYLKDFVRKVFPAALFRLATSANIIVQSVPPTPAPTPSPTAKPTLAPTAKPTTAPTGKPTAAPTGKPTTGNAPTAKPTAAPTGKPTLAGAPTAKPTAAPTKKPTASPTGKPTASPTGKPTVASAPTAKPTAAPTKKPTAAPTGKPTASPTGKPTVASAPTAKPTAAPTGKPTAAPTGKPTVTSPPTAKPTAAPTLPPTGTPTRKPTAAPTLAPAPTRKPTLFPTRNPAKGNPL